MDKFRSPPVILNLFRATEILPENWLKDTSIFYEYHVTSNIVPIDNIKKIKHFTNLRNTRDKREGNIKRERNLEHLSNLL